MAGAISVSCNVGSAKPALVGFSRLCRLCLKEPPPALSVSPSFSEIWLWTAVPTSYR